MSQIWYSIVYKPSGVPGVTLTSAVAVLNSTPGSAAGVSTLITISSMRTCNPLRESLSSAFPKIPPVEPLTGPYKSSFATITGLMLTVTSAVSHTVGFSTSQIW